MPRPALPRPSDGELEILHVLWSSGGSTVRQLQQALQKDRPRALQSVLTLLKVMLGKGLVSRDDSARPQVFYAAVTESRVKRHLLRDLLARVFGGSSKNLVLHTLAVNKTSAKDIEEIRRHLDELDAKGD